MARDEGRQSAPGWRRPLLLVAALLALAFGLLQLRDLPRRWVERLLAQRLAAEVDLGSFSIRGLRDFRLEEIRIRRPGVWPEIQAARVLALEVQGGIRAILAGRYDLLSFDGLEVTLSPLVPARVVGADEGPSLEADRVQVRRGAIVLDGPDETLSCEIEAFLEDLGRDPRGGLAIRCGRLSSGPILSFLRSRTAATAEPSSRTLAGGFADLAVDAEDVEADVILGGGIGRLEARANLSGVLVSWAGAETEVGSLAVRVTPEAGRSRLDIESSSPTPLADSMQATLWLGDPSRQWTRLDGSVRRLRLAAARDLAASRFSDWTLDAVADVDVSGNPETGFSVTGTAAVSRLSRAGTDQPVRGSELRFEGRLPADGDNPRATVRAHLDVPLGADKNVVRSLPASILPLTADLEGEWDAAGERFSASSLEIRTARLGSLTVSGSVRGLLEEPEIAADWTWSGSRLADLVAAAGPAAGGLEGAIELHGSVQGRGDLWGPLASPSTRATLGIEALQLALPAPREAPMSPVPGSPWSFRAEPFESIWFRSGGGPSVSISLPRFGATIDLAGLPSLAVEIAGNARIDPTSGTLHLETAELETHDLGRGHLAGTLAAGGDADLDLRWTEASLPAWLAYLAPRLGPIPADVQVHGTAQLDLELARAAPGPWRAAGSLSLAGGGFEAAGGSQVLQDLRLQADLDGSQTPGSRVEVRSSIRAGGFQLLWGTAFADYTDREVELAATVAAQRPADDADWTWRGDVSSQLAGTSTLAAGFCFGSNRILALTADARVGDLGAFLDEYLVQPLQGSVGPLDRVRAAGSLRANLTASLGPDTRAATGRLEAQGIDARTAGGGLRVGGLDLDLPFDLAWSRDSPGGSTTIGGPESRGRLSFDELSAAGLTVPPFSANLVVQGDSVALEESLEVRLLGGKVELGRLTLSEVLRPARHAAATLRLDGIQLSELSRSQGWPPLEGEVSGRFPRMRVTGGTLHVDGGGAVSVFGGEVTVSDISGAEIFSDYPRLNLSADFRDIDLARLTRKLDFGEMTGTVEGYIRDLELFRGTPVRFKARLVSLPRQGVPRTIGFRAIDNLAMLGGGGHVGLLNRGVGKFFDRYRYRQLGVAMVLDNDHFLLRGLTRRGNQELFIKGRPPLRLDMVNVQPGRTVSFRTMIDRVNNLQITKKPVGAGGS